MVRNWREEREEQKRKWWLSTWVANYVGWGLISDWNLLHAKAYDEQGKCSRSAVHVHKTEDTAKIGEINEKKLNDELDLSKPNGKVRCYSQTANNSRDVHSFISAKLSHKKTRS